VQGYEDWLRHKADREVNNRPSAIVERGLLKDCKSMDIKVT
jgi:phospholipid-translocating ATPase